MSNDGYSLGHPARLLGVVAAAVCALVAAGQAQVNVLTYHNDNARTGQNLLETVLKPSNVNQAQFGKLFTQRVDGYVYAQPLCVSNVSIPGKGVHNVVYVATEHDSVYAFDADTKTGPTRAPLWKRSFRDPRARVGVVPSRDTGCDDLVPEIGITGTPVIDGTTSTMYVVAKTKEHGSYFQRLHALDITTGLDEAGSPVAITATVPGTGDGSSGGMVTFDPLREHQRPALLLLNGVVYIAWASHCDNGPYHGWIIGYDATTLAPAGVYNTTPDGGLGGIWHGGGGLAADGSGNIFTVTGNGTFDADMGGNDVGDSFIKVSTSGPLTLADYFTPYNQAALESGDIDLGSGAALLLPDQGGAHSHLVVSAGKEGTIYLVDRDNMGHFNVPDDSQIVQSIITVIGGLFGTPAYWNGNVYLGGNGDALKAFALTAGVLSTSPTSQSQNGFGFPGATPTLSANGAADGIVWALERDLGGSRPRAILHAYDATNLANELYNSTQAGRRDAAGYPVKFTPPTVANGKVYVPARKRLTVYGLR